ncbi:MAG: sensor histidine kinase [Aeromicrobium sp.]
MRRRSLVQQIVLIAMGGAVVVSLVTALLSVQLVRSVATQQARKQLSTSVETLAAKPAVTTRLFLRERQVVGPDDRLFAVTTTSGTVVGPGSSHITDEQIAKVRQSGSLSDRVEEGGVALLIEGRAMKAGGAAFGVQPVAAADEAAKAMTRRIMLALVIGLAIAGVVGAVIARRMAWPVSAAADAARRLAGGERGIPLTDSGVREIAEMSEAVESLDEALAVSEHRQREFLLSISHEIRTPLTALRGYAEALADGTVGADQMRAVGETLTAETARLDRFVADLLALARFEADDFHIQRSEIDLRGVIDGAARAWAAQVGNLGIDLEVDAPAAIAMSGDAERVRQVLDGLIENAARVTPAGGVIVVRARDDGDEVVITVEDSGPGLSEGDTDVAFERGRLHAKYESVRPVGTGLGLSIAERLTERMGGSITAGGAVTGGAAFTVRLPRI